MNEDPYSQIADILGMERDCIIYTVGALNLFFAMQKRIKRSKFGDDITEKDFEILFNSLFGQFRNGELELMKYPQGYEHCMEPRCNSRNALINAYVNTMVEKNEKEFTIKDVLDCIKQNNYYRRVSK